jgi:hypothetical protein
MAIRTQMLTGAIYLGVNSGQNDLFMDVGLVDPSGACKLTISEEKKTIPNSYSGEGTGDTDYMISEITLELVLRETMNLSLLHILLAGTSYKDLAGSVVDEKMMLKKGMMSMLAHLNPKNLSIKSADYVGSTLNTGVEINNNALLWTSLADNTLYLKIVKPNTDNAIASASFLNDVITINLATGVGPAATLVTGAVGTANGIEYTAVDAGLAGNDITMEYANPGVAGAALSVGVTSKAIKVNLATSGVATAALDTDGIGTMSVANNNAVTFTAVTPGATANDLGVGYNNPGAPGQAIAASKSNNYIEVSLGTSPAVQSTASTGSAPSNNLLAWTAVTAGSNGDLLSIEIIDSGSGGFSSSSITYNSGTGAIVVDMAGDTPTASQVITAVPGSVAGAVVSVTNGSGSDGSGAIVITAPVSFTGGDDGGTINSTAAQVIDAINNNSEITQFVTAGNSTGSSGAGVVEVLAETHLTGGDNGGDATTIASEVISLINNDTNASALVSAAAYSGSPTTGLVDVQAATNLSNGDISGSITSTANTIKTLIDNTPSIAALVSVEHVGASTGAGLMTILAQTAFSGGTGIFYETGIDYRVLPGAGVYGLETSPKIIDAGAEAFASYTHQDEVRIEAITQRPQPIMIIVEEYNKRDPALVGRTMIWNVQLGTIAEMPLNKSDDFVSLTLTGTANALAVDSPIRNKQISGLDVSMGTSEYFTKIYTCPLTESTTLANVIPYNLCSA